MGALTDAGKGPESIWPKRSPPSEVTTIPAEERPDQSVPEIARQHAVARRKLGRRFREETGMSFGMGRQNARLLDSIRLLAEGKSVTDAALDCGY